MQKPEKDAEKIQVIPLEQKPKRTLQDLIDEARGKNKKKKDIPRQEKVKKSLWYSIMDGTFYSTMLGFGESFFSAFAIFLKATNLQIGVLGTLPDTIGSLTQLWSNTLLKWFNSRKKLICTMALLEALMYIPIALVFFMGTFKVIHLILFICIYHIFDLIINPAWNSWMGDLVDTQERGDYFGKRNRITGIATFLSLLLGGFILQRFVGDVKTQYTGFVVLFALAFLSRIASFIYLTRKYEPQYTFMPEEEVSLLEFVKKAWFRNYGILIIFLCAMNFVVFLASPFFAAYMLYDLKLSYWSFTILMAAAVISKFIFMPVWGRLCDKYGTKKVLRLTSFLIPLGCLPWIFSTNFFYLIIVEAVSGFVWAGFEISSFNMLFDSIIPQKRATYIAYFNVLNGVGIFLAALIGTLIITFNNIFWSSYLFVFLISGILRLAVAFYFTPKLKEVRQVERISYHQLLFRVLTTTAAAGLVYDWITFKKQRKVKVMISKDKESGKLAVQVYRGF